MIIDRYERPENMPVASISDPILQELDWIIVCDPKLVFKTQALLCTDVTVSPEQILAWFVRRWQVEVTFHEVRTHLGVETQRHGRTSQSCVLHQPCSVYFPS
jgi:hypothetical protein